MKRVWIWPLILALLLAGCLSPAKAPAQTNEIASETESVAATAPSALQTPAEVADFVREHGELPAYYLTKKEAGELGWIAEKGNLWEVAEGRVIGGDRFGNRERLLPEKSGRIYYEADVNYQGGHRGAERLVYSNDGLIYYTADHYDSFENWTEESP